MGAKEDINELRQYAERFPAEIEIQRFGVEKDPTDLKFGIAEVAAKSGYGVVLRARSKQRVSESMAAVEKSLAKAVQRGKMTEDQLKSTTALIDVHTTAG